MRKSIIAAAVLALSLTPALATEMVKTVKTAKGAVLTDAKGMTLYTFDKDGKGVSNCYGPCAKKWPPLMAAKGAHAKGGFSAIMRKDGSAQWAYKGKPLYTWFKDTKAGDMTGDGVKNVWHTARP